MVADYVEELLDDIEQNRRGFLPGSRPTRDEIISNLSGALLVDGLTKQEAALVLSTLPGGSQNFYLAPLDKGLSGAMVYAGRYELADGSRSKQFVLKIGERRKVEREEAAIVNVAAPKLMGVAPPLVRFIGDRGILVQDLAGLRDRAKLRSLRNVVRSSPSGPQVIDILLRDRLSPWYTASEDSEPMAFTFAEVFERNLRKGPTELDHVVPQGWEDYPAWVERNGFARPRELIEMTDEVKNESFRSICTSIHGDLHTQNVLVEEQENRDATVWPIDFAWTVEQSSAIVDLVMLECSLKFLAMPMRSELGSLCALEAALIAEEHPHWPLGAMPYSVEIKRVFDCIAEVRDFALNDLGFTFDTYRKALLLMTFSLMTHPGLNQPYIWASAQMIAEELE